MSEFEDYVTNIIAKCAGVAGFEHPGEFAEYLWAELHEAGLAIVERVFRADDEFKP